MPLELESVMFRGTDPARAAAFWATMLHRTPQEDADGILLAGTPTQVGLRFSQAARARRSRTVCTCI